MRSSRKAAALAAFLFILPLPLWAATHDVGLTHEITRLLIQLGLIILLAKAGGSIAVKFGLPPLLGEIILGLTMGPYALGSIPVYGFHDGIIPLAGADFPISIQLYGFAAVGAIIHVLVVGLESDIGLISRAQSRGLAIALGGSLAALLVGILSPMLFFDLPFLHRKVFFFAALSISTSLGVQARILQMNKQMASPEGATIMSSALLQDGFSIIFLALAMAVGGLEARERIWATVLPLTLLALTILTAGGLLSFFGAPLLAKRFMKWSSANHVIVIVIGMTLIISGLFEVFGVAAIIGAYVLGLSFSRTDLGDVLVEKSQPVSEFFVPILYVVMGMLVNWRVLFTPHILLPGIGFALLSGAGKILGSGIPALYNGFTWKGALRVGIGTVPRGEVALIISSVGLALGVFSPDIFQIMVVMVVFSVSVATPLLTAVLKMDGKGTRGDWGSMKMAEIITEFPNRELSNLIIQELLKVADEDGFFVHRLELDGAVYRLRKESIFITVHHSGTTVRIVCDPQDEGLAKTLMYEVIIHVKDRVTRISEVIVPQELRRDAAGSKGRENSLLDQYLDERTVFVSMKAGTKEEVITRLVEGLDRTGQLLDSQQVLKDVLEREQSVSTGLEKGIATPHARTAGTKDMILAVGLCEENVDFQALDGKPSRLVFLIISPAESKMPHLQLLASIAQTLKKDEIREPAMKAGTSRELYRILSSRTPA
ncbi:MAG: cation:proton antiporter [Spirochaetales bacterium]|nr:cation:proton antiporter [Spirochaetales bacterium]